MTRQRQAGAKKAVVRLSSKGQFTLPSILRKRIGLKQGDYLKAYTIGDKLILLEKVPATLFEDLAARFSQVSAKKALDEKRLATLIKEARREVHREIYGV